MKMAARVAKIMIRALWRERMHSLDVPTKEPYRYILKSPFLGNLTLTYNYIKTNCNQCIWIVEWMLWLDLPSVLDVQHPTENNSFLEREKEEKEGEGDRERGIEADRPRRECLCPRSTRNATRRRVRILFSSRDA